MNQKHTPIRYLRVLALCTVLCWSGIASATPTTNPTKSKHIKQYPHNWHKRQIATACRVAPATIQQVMRYRFSTAQSWSGIVLAVLKHQRGQRSIALFYRRCKSGHCPGACHPLHSSICPKRQCTQSARALQVVHLGQHKHKPSTHRIDPAAGSWYETPLVQPKQSSPTQAVIVQVRTDFGTGSSIKGREWTILLEMQQTNAGRQLFKTTSLELWSPKHQALQKMEAGGIRMHSMQLVRRPQMPTELVVLKKGIPTALNRCICKRLDESKRYRLSKRGFRRVHAM